MKTILMFPWLAHGHVSPYLELAKRLAARGFTVHLCSTAVILEAINEPLINLVELHLASTEQLPPEYHTTKGLPPHLMGALKEALHASGPQSFSDIMERVSPDLVVYDFIQSWAPALASSRNIPAVEFRILNASFISYIMSLNPSNPRFPFPEIWMSDSEVSALKQPGEGSATTHRHISEAQKRSHKIVLSRTFPEMEGKYIDHMSSLLGGGRRLIPVGPLLPDFDSSSNSHPWLIEWLDAKGPLSTVFVSFGSEYYPSKEQIEEIAIGLELSSVNFVWTIRLPGASGQTTALQLPFGFVDRVGERGVVVHGWAPQTRILAHPSLGAFVSHCGWSSVLESMSFGVPIIAMPMQIDQPVNARLITSIGVGLEVPKDENGEYKRHEICRAITRVVLEEDGERCKRKAKEYSQVMLDKGDQDVDVVAQELAQICKEYGNN